VLLLVLPVVARRDIQLRYVGICSSTGSMICVVDAALARTSIVWLLQAVTFPVGAEH
jgi:hypothetical protein